MASSFLLKQGVELFVELGLPDGPLPIRSRIAHVVAIDDPKLTSGMGVEFLDVDAQGREPLLRYFTPTRYHRFYDRFTEEFPHLKKDLPLRDVSLVLNLWEEDWNMADLFYDYFETRWDMEKSRLSGEKITGQAEASDFIYAPAGAKTLCMTLWNG